jgi:ribonuclease P protein component
MPKLILLKKDADFAAFRKSKSYNSELLRIRVHFQANQNVPRFGFIVPKKAVAKAADRNLLRRRIKALLTKAAPNMHPVDILIFPTKGLVKKKPMELQEILGKLFTQARLWKS